MNIINVFSSLSLNEMGSEIDLFFFFSKNISYVWISL